MKGFFDEGLNLGMGVLNNFVYFLTLNQYIVSLMVKKTYLS